MASVKDAATAAARADAVPGSILVVVHNFEARSPDELSLSKGDRIQLIERDDEFNDGWFLGKLLSTGISGLFPEVYTTPAPKSSFLSSASSSRRTSGLTSHANPPQGVPTSQQTRPASASTTPTHQRAGSGSSFSSKSANPTSSRSSMPSVDGKAMHIAATQSPVMHETLTVIDEHMNDLVPQHNTRNQPRRDTMGSMYSTYPKHRASYVPGHETEDEENEVHTEQEVLSWNVDQVAEYLEDHGVERAHCQIFREQEITGEVLLAMDQTSVFLKEFDLGAVGRRLRTWHKIKALQDEIRRQNKAASKVNSPTTPGAVELDANNSTRDRSISAASVLSTNIMPLRNSGGYTVQPAVPNRPVVSRTNSAASGGIGVASTTSTADTAYRPSAQSIRTMQHWRHSSADSTKKPFDGQGAGHHRKKSSVDHRSQLNGRTAHHSHNPSTDTMSRNHREGMFSSPAESSPHDFEKGYFSSTEADTRARRSVLQKRQNSASVSSAHSRNGSFIMFQRRGTPSNRAASTDSLDNPLVSPISTPLQQQQQQQQQQDSFQKSGATRNLTMPTFGNKVMSPVNESGPPVVTKLDHNTPPSTGAVNTPLTATTDSPSSANTPQSSSKHLPFFSKTSKIPGMRTISDAVTKNEKTSAGTPTTTKSSDSPFPSKDGMSTPSTEAASLEMKADSRNSAGSVTALAPQPGPRKPRTKTKKDTSAYTRGLEKKTPAEQMVGCDYSGWMKKKSGSLMSAWKPRLFVLRGRRLSYYYSEDDTEEKGLIDISFHNVIPAMDEKLVSMHAAVTGASGTVTPTSPHTDRSLITTAQLDMMERPIAPGSEDDNLFIFKLTPPKSGRGVNFTKPTVHYFAVKSRQEGRLWMAALMKAVIDRDQDAVVTTTYNQKTISLAKARAARARPPAFKEDDGGVAVGEYTIVDDKGLGIGVEPGVTNGASVLGRADGNERSYLMEDGSSMAPSTNPTTAPSVKTNMSFDIDKEQLAKVVQ